VLVTGMAVGTLFTLFVVPAIYMLVARNHSAKRQTAEADETEPEIISARGGVVLATSREATLSTKGADHESPR
jgi:hypothetical protein